MTSFLEFARTLFPSLLEGTALTLEIWVVSMLGGIVLGLLLAVGRVYGNDVVYAPSTGYIELFRGTPMLVQMFFLYFGLPDIGIVLRPIVAASLAIALNSAAYQAEYFRGGIQSIQAGQMLAARSLGMTEVQAILYIILPQALRIVIPQWSNEAVLELKFTSIAFAIGVSELTSKVHILGYSSFRYFETFLVAAFIYLTLTTVVAQLLDILANKVKVPGLGMG